jgi:hypothetical protein
VGPPRNQEDSREKKNWKCSWDVMLLLLVTSWVAKTRN